MNIDLHSKIFNSQGQQISLVKKIGHGGEGSVFEIKDSDSLVAKLYSTPVNTDKAEKLSLMATLKTDRLLNISAWPVDTLHEKPRGNIIGFLMQKATGYKEIHNLYSPKTRLKEFPDAHWPFLIHSATNVARVFSVIHEHGHIIGDVNHANILISKQSTILLIDCDSFQINTPTKKFLCEVGISTHTPPELQGKSFRNVIRNENHDLFGLSVMIFQLLFMGRHPFAGRYLGNGDISLEKAIEEYRFAYSVNTSFTEMEQPPATLSLSALSTEVTQLFEQAFSKSLIRPKATDWVKALSEMASNLKKCTNNASHDSYNLSDCPWCNIELKSGISLFNVKITATYQNFKHLDITSIWLQIEAVQPPGPTPPLSNKHSITVNPSTQVYQYKKDSTKKKVFNCIVIIIVASIAIVSFHAVELTCCSLPILIFLMAGIVSAIKEKSNYPKLLELEKARKENEQQLGFIMQRWDKEANETRFFSKKHELEQKKKEYDNLPDLRNQKLEFNNRNQQLIKFLNQYSISDAVIDAIGKSRKAMLLSYGIETAADLFGIKSISVPGFGPSLSFNLFYWYKSVEQKFVFNPTQSTDSAYIAKLDKEMGILQLQLESELSDGVAQLTEINQKIQNSRKELYPSVTEYLNSLAQIEADINFIKGK